MAIDTELQQTKIFKKIFLKNSKITYMTGDSIASRFVDNAGYIFSKANKNFIENKAIAGSNIAKITVNDPAIWNPQSFVGRSETTELNIKNADLLIIWGGFNDVGDEVPLGALNSTDIYTTAGAIRIGVQNYLVQNPNLKVMVITPNSNPYKTPNTLGLNIIDYRNHIITICADMDIPCFDLYSVDGITDTNKATALPDQIHPSATFLRTWSPLITDFIKNNVIL